MSYLIKKLCYIEKATYRLLVILEKAGKNE